VRQIKKTLKYICRLGVNRIRPISNSRCIYQDALSAMQKIDEEQNEKDATEIQERTVIKI